MVYLTQRVNLRMTTATRLYELIMESIAQIIESGRQYLASGRYHTTVLHHHCGTSTLVHRTLHVLHILIGNIHENVAVNGNDFSRVGLC